MIWPFMICAYVVTSLLLGLMFHLAAWFDGPASPKPAEIVVFFLVFSVIGIPLVLATLFFSSFSFSSNPQMSKNLMTKEISQG